MQSPQDNFPAHEVERLLYQCEQSLDALFPRSVEDVRELEAMFGTTPVELPERLREPRDVLRRIVSKGGERPLPSAFGNLVTMLRTEKKLSVEELAVKTDLDAEDLHRIEAGVHGAASPLAVVTLAGYFRLDPQKLSRIAGLTKQSQDGGGAGALSLAACARPEFDKLTARERACFHDFVKELRKKGR